MPSWWTAGEEYERAGEVLSMYLCTSCHLNATLSLPPSPRHPDPHSRPAASSLCFSLNQPEKALLFWNHSTPAAVLSPSAHILGAPLEEGHKLYEDLQSTYLDYI